LPFVGRQLLDVNDSLAILIAIDGRTNGDFARQVLVGVNGVRGENNGPSRTLNDHELKAAGVAAARFDAHSGSDFRRAVQERKPRARLAQCLQVILDKSAGGALAQTLNQRGCALLFPAL